jgi:C-terminal processing protease CtpA/Prc
METYSIRKRLVDWVDLRRRVFDAAGDARTPGETYYAIRFGLRLIGDGHSFFEPPDGQVAAANGVTAGVIRGEVLSEGVAYVTVPGIIGATEHPETVLFAERLQSRLRELDAKEPCGWIADLRGNTGGNMWPMLVGIGPVLGEGVVGAFVDPEGVRVEWFYEDGAAGVNSQLIIGLGASAYTLRGQSPPVAVLTSRSTGSSGEAVAIAFKGRPRTRSFGAPTGGFSTANQAFRLSDGAILFLTVSTMADRTGRLYGSVVEVDEEIENVELAQPAGATVDAANHWLVGMCS